MSLQIYPSCTDLHQSALVIRPLRHNLCRTEQEVFRRPTEESRTRRTTGRCRRGFYGRRAMLRPCFRCRFRCGYPDRPGRENRRFSGGFGRRDPRCFVRYFLWMLTSLADSSPMPISRYACRQLGDGTGGVDTGEWRRRGSIGRSRPVARRPARTALPGRACCCPAHRAFPLFRSPGAVSWSVPSRRGLRWRAGSGWGASAALGRRPVGY